MRLLDELDSEILFDETEEYLCLYCDKVSELPGVCDVHNMRLLEFSEWVKVGGKNQKFIAKQHLLSLAVVALSCVAAYFWKFMY